jgi:UDP-2-acetamido-3-amino-2,3-dideoxy-glucuronate N-acetyltransferase
MIRDGRLGRIEYIYSNRLNIGKLRTEENILWSFAPHDISVILSLVGEEPVNVISSGGDYLSKGIYDITMTTLEFKDGVKGHIFVSWLHPFKEQKLIVVGRKAMAVFDDMTKDKLFIYPHRIEWKDGRIPVALKAEHYPVPVEEGEPLREEARHFMECVKKRKRPRTDAAEGVRVLNVLERAEMSLKKRQDVFIHPTSYIDEGVVIGKGTRIWHFSHIMKDTKIGKSCIIGQNVTAGPDVSIGDRCKIQNNVSIYKGVKLEDEVFCGPSSVFTNVYTPRAFIERKDEFLPTLVKKGATIGANATIVCGVVIGKYAFVAAGAVVKKDVADYGLVAGVPARQIGWACRCGVPLKGLETAKEARCGRCKASYRLKGGNLVIL